MSGQGLLKVLNCSSVAYKSNYSTYPYSAGSSTNNNTPGYNPTSVANSHFTVYSQTAASPYYTTFIQQTISTDGTTGTGGVSTSIISFPAYIQKFAVDADPAGGNLLYMCAMADLTLNSPTNPNSSVYNIFLNLGIFSNGVNSQPFPFLKKYQYGKTNGVCDVILSLEANGKMEETAVFSLNSSEIAANDGVAPVSSTNAAKSGTTLFTLCFPISSIFPQISTPGVIFRLKAEIVGYV